MYTFTSDIKLSSVNKQGLFPSSRIALRKRDLRHKEPCLNHLEKVFSLLVLLLELTQNQSGLQGSDWFPSPVLGSVMPFLLGISGKHRFCDLFSVPWGTQWYLGIQETENHNVCSRSYCFSPGKTQDGTPITNCVLPPLSGSGALAPIVKAAQHVTYV